MLNLYSQLIADSNPIQSKLKQRNPSRIGAELTAKVGELIQHGLSVAEIAERLDVSKTSVYTAHIHLGVTPISKPIPSAMVSFSDLHKHLSQGLTLNSFAQKNGLTKSAVGHALRKKYGTAKTSVFLKRYKNETK